MVVRTRQKKTRHRGSRTGGWGRMHRGAGDRGGVGNAGTGKRADCKKPTSDRIKKYFGRHGFSPRGRTNAACNPINVCDLEMRLASFIQKGGAHKKDDGIHIDLSKLGYTKLLGRGRVTQAFVLTGAQASKRAKELIEQAGGKVN